jgi:hypothetical protein
VFSGGIYDPHAIASFDWASNEYTNHTAHWTGSRKYSACAMLRGKHGEHLVAAAAGASAGMEVWNPLEGTVTTVTDDFPVLTGDNRAPRMISGADGSQLFYYDSLVNVNNPLKGIWKFEVGNATWTQVGEMLQPRDDFTVVAVRNIACP